MVISYIKLVIRRTDSDRYFNPVGKSWQYDKCKLLDDAELVETPEFYEDTIKILKHPSKFQIIDKDGNCLFRALSYWVTGMQTMHGLLREKVAEIVKTNEKISNYLGGEEEVDNHFKIHKTDSESAWGTEVEIFGAAILLQTSIFVFETDRKSWNLFNKDLDLEYKYESTEKCIYLINISNEHFNVVTNVGDEEYSEYDDDVKRIDNREENENDAFSQEEP